MKEILYSYFLAFIHPFKFAGYSSGQKDIEFWKDGGARRLTLSELISVSWIFIIVYGIYQLFIYNFGHYLTRFFELFTIPRDNKFLLLYLMMEVVFFPITVFFLLMFWEWIIRLFASFYGVEVKDHKDFELVVSNALAGNGFLAIPVFGSVLARLSWPFYLLAGMKNILGFTLLQSVSVFILLSLLSMSLIIATILFIIVSISFLS